MYTYQIEDNTTSYQKDSSTCFDLPESSDDLARYVLHSSHSLSVSVPLRETNPRASKISRNRWHQHFRSIKLCRLTFEALNCTVDLVPVGESRIARHPAQ